MRWCRHVRYTSQMTYDGHRWVIPGSTTCRRISTGKKSRLGIEAHVTEMLAQTNEWPVMLDVPHAGREVTGDMRLWLIDHRTGPAGQSTRWRSAPAQNHPKAK